MIALAFSAPVNPLMKDLNGAGAVLGGFLLGILSLYLIKEHRRRELRLHQWWFKLPPSMHFAIATYIFVAGTSLRFGAIWLWREFGASPTFGGYSFGALVAGGVLSCIGALCMIRSLSKPDYGDGPWMLAAAAVFFFLFVSSVLG